MTDHADLTARLHVLTEPGGACVENCPHPVHRPCSTCGGSGTRYPHLATFDDPCPDCREVS